MGKLEFTKKLTAKKEELLLLATDYERLPRFLPDQLKSVRVIEKNNEKTITEEEIVFSSLVKNTIKQQSVHKIISDNHLVTEIISGPAKNTVLNAIYEDNGEGTTVSVSIDLKLSLKAKFLSPIIKKLYKTVMTGILYKMNDEVLKKKMKGNV